MQTEAFMRTSHVIYGVEDLSKSVEEWRDKGFKVEYGVVSKKLNAMIYFSEGPYIELFNTNLPSIVKIFMKLYFFIKGGKSFTDRLVSSNVLKSNNGIFCIEKDPGNLDDEIAFLKKKGIKGYFFNGKRKHFSGNILTWKTFFPNDLGLPFLATFFDDYDPRPKNFVHPNGIKGIKTMTLLTDARSVKILKKMVDDKRLLYKVGNAEAQIVNLVFEYA